MKILYEKTQYLTEQIINNMINNDGKFIGFTNNNKNAVFITQHGAAKSIDLLNIIEEPLFDTTKPYTSLICELAEQNGMIDQLHNINSKSCFDRLGVASVYYKDIASNFPEIRKEGSKDHWYKGKLYCTLIFICTLTCIPYTGLDRRGDSRIMTSTNALQLLFKEVSANKERASKYLGINSKQLSSMSDNSLMEYLKPLIIEWYGTDKLKQIYKSNIDAFFNPYIILNAFTPGFKTLNFWYKYRQLNIRAFKTFPYDNKGEFILQKINLGSEDVDNETFDKLVQFQLKIN